MVLSLTVKALRIEAVGYLRHAVETAMPGILSRCWIIALEWGFPGFLQMHALTCPPYRVDVTRNDLNKDEQGTRTLMILYV